jgi:hypothetical protein
MATGGERWVFTVQLPAGVPNPGRFVARLLKHLLRTWDVRCLAVGESAELRRLRGIIDGLAERIATQAELLARRAEGERRDTNGAPADVQTPAPRDANGRV